MKKPRYATLLLLMALLLGVGSSPLVASDASTKLPYGIGVQFSPSVWGLSYHQQFDKHALQATVGIMYDPDPLWDWTSVLSYGVALDYQRTLYESSWNKSLSALLYTTTSLAHTGEITSDSGVRGPYTAAVIAAVGFGVEVLFFQNFSLPLELAYEFSYEPTTSDSSKAFGLDLVPRIGFRFRFK